MDKLKECQKCPYNKRCVVDKVKKENDTLKESLKISQELNEALRKENADLKRELEKNKEEGR